MKKLDLNSVIITGEVRRKSQGSASLTMLDVECVTKSVAGNIIPYVFGVEAPTRLTIGIQPGDYVRLAGHIEDRGGIGRVIIGADHVEVREEAK